jgi:hypothetical protein
MDLLTPVLVLVGISHLSLIAAGAQLPRVLGLRAQIARLDPFPAHLFWTYYGFIGLSLVGFGAGTALFARELASGTPLARGMAGFLCVFWTARLWVHLFLFDPAPYLATWGRRVGYRLLTAQFAVFSAVYAWACLAPGGRP